MSEIVSRLIESVHAECIEDRSGEILHGIPALEDVDPDTFGICVATADGYVYEVGDTRLPFCIQSISKAFTYGIALTDRGIDAVDAKIDVEPSGDLFNQISLHPVTHRPRNPMINAGAIVAASLVAGEMTTDQAERIRSIYSAYAGSELGLEEEIFESQVESGHRNRAISHMVREFEILEGDPNDAIEVYLRACSTMVTCRDLSLMGATLANTGVQPLTGERVIDADLTERVLSVMLTCGMYDAAGAWAAQVGMAAKSGVGGGIVAVLPGQLAIAAFSPRLDEHGNSVRAFAACRQLSNQLELHALHVARAAESAIRDSYGILQAPSSLQRPEADRRVLEEHGHKARVYELHGDLLFAGAESVVREISTVGEELDLLIVDVRRVTAVAGVAARLLTDLRDHLRDHGVAFAMIDTDGVMLHDQVPGALGEGTDPPTPEEFVAGSVAGFPTISAATAFCEDVLIERYGESRPASEEFRFEDHPAFEGVSADVVEKLGGYMQPRSFDRGERIVEAGDAESGVFLIMSGRVRSSLTTPSGETRSLATLIPGTCFGDVYVVTGNPHPLTMHAQGPVEALELTRSEFERIADEDPELHAAVLQVFMYAIHDDLDRSLMALGNGRVAPMTAS